MLDSLEEIKQTASISDLTDESSFCTPLSFFRSGVNVFLSIVKLFITRPRKDLHLADERSQHELFLFRSLNYSVKSICQCRVR